MKVIARKPRDGLCISEDPDFRNEYVVIDRGGKGPEDHPYVVATANLFSLKHGEWFWGSYHPTLEAAMTDFNAR